jgi:hypothetical protein
LHQKVEATQTYRTLIDSAAARTQQAHQLPRNPSTFSIPLLRPLSLPVLSKRQQKNKVPQLVSIAGHDLTLHTLLASRYPGSELFLKGIITQGPIPNDSKPYIIVGIGIG